MKQSCLDTDIGNKEFEILRNQEHVDEVWTVMKPIVEKYANSYLDEIPRDKNASNPHDKFSIYLQCLIKDNDKLNEIYHELFDMDIMNDEYAEDTESFKSVILIKDVEVIRNAINSKSEALKEWRAKFFATKSQILYDTFYNMISFAVDYDKKMDEDTINSLDKVYDCSLDEMRDEACYKAGVIGYGIVSNILNHMYPRVFPGKYKSGVWSLYFLSNGTKQIHMPSGTSEFSMVKDETCSKTGIYEMEHNYFFPYEVFCIYTLRIYRILVNKILARFNMEYPSEYRFLITNKFYEYVTSNEKASINTLSGNDDILKLTTPW